MLDWVLGGAAATQPASRLAALSLGTPSSISGSEVDTNSGYARQTALFGAAASPAGSASNTAAMTFGPFSSSNAIQGLLIYDTISINSGNIWWYGTLLTARTVLPGDTLVVATGALIVRRIRRAGSSFSTESRSRATCWSAVGGSFRLARR